MFGEDFVYQEEEDPMRIVNLIADYGSLGDLAWSEVTSALYRVCPEDTVVVPTQVPPFSEEAAAFAAYQLACRVPVGEGKNTIIFTNVDARTHTRARIVDGDGNSLYVGVLGGNSVHIVGPGLTTFAIAKQARDLRLLARINMAQWSHQKVPGQFRSRDAFTLVVAELLWEKDVRPFVEASVVGRENVPVLPPIIGITDGYGNIKTNIPRSTVAAEGVVVRIEEIEHCIRLVPGLFALDPGELGLYPGSSGSDEDRFLELAVRYDDKRKPLEDTAAKRFGNPKPGARVFVDSITASVGATA